MSLGHSNSTAHEPTPSVGAPRNGLRWLALALVLAALGGSITGYRMRLELPSVRQLAERRPPEMTRILARDGTRLAVFGWEKRLLLDSGEIPDTFRRALIASEDARFFEHPGIDVLGVLRALGSDLRHRRIVSGASTLTMQLAGNLFLDRSQRTLRRKLQEVFLALEIERHFSKQEILRLYTNQVHFGHGLYGLEAAARFYFGRTASGLSLAESATLVGLLPRPASYSPLRDPELARRRRDHVLRRMVDEGYLLPAEAERALQTEMVVTRQEPPTAEAPYFTEEVRRELQEVYGSDGLYGGGLVVRTTLDPRLQRIANRAMDAGLRALDKRQGWRRNAVRKVPEGTDLEHWESPAWAAQSLAAGNVTDAVVLSVGPDSAVVRVGERRGLLDRAAVSWTGQSRVDRLLEAGDLIRVRVGEARGEDGALRLELEQTPAVEGALVALDPASGEILALVGGFDFGRSEYNRATQARRQPGSLFKPFVYAAALAGGATLADTLLDEPTVFLAGRRAVPYQPENFSRSYHGTVTLRTALEQSLNIATVRLLDGVGCRAVIDLARGLGIESPLQPYPSLALGAFELTLLEVTSAYGGLANQGMLLAPHAILGVRRSDGRILHEARPRVHEALPPEIAYLTTQALVGVLERGTGRSAGAVLRHPLAGKTGTTDDYTDAWFVGYTPRLVVGVWVGFDEPRSLGPGETGARAALPIWTDFVREALTEAADVQFPRPEGITRVRVDPGTGLRASDEADCRTVLEEWFLEGTEPAEWCRSDAHRKLELPYPLQRYVFDSRGALGVPEDELDRLLTEEPNLETGWFRHVLRVRREEDVLRVPLRVLPPTAPVDDEPVGGTKPPEARGTDGRPARIVHFRG